jgi:hypothetical protein
MKERGLNANEIADKLSMCRRDTNLFESKWDSKKDGVE